MNNLLQNLGKDSSILQVSGLRGSGKMLMAAHVAKQTGRMLLYVVPTERQVGMAEQDFAVFTDLPIYQYPGFDIPPYTPLSPDQVTVATRLATLYKLLDEKGPAIIVASCEALIRRVIPKTILGGRAELIIRNEDTDQHELVGRLVANGYESVSLVQTVGDFSLRGGILDVFPPGFETPLRLDFFGDTVESLRTFDPITQRSLTELGEAVLLPASNILFPAPDKAAHLHSLFLKSAKELQWASDDTDFLLEKIKNNNRFPGIEFFLPLFYADIDTCYSPLGYLAADAFLVIDDPLETKRSLDLVWERIMANYQEAQEIATPALEPQSLFLTQESLQKEMAQFSCLYLHDFPPEDALGQETVTYKSGNHILLKQEIDLQRRQQGLLTPLTARIRNWFAENHGVFMACRSARHAAHFAELLGHHQINTQIVAPPLDSKQFLSTKNTETITLLEQPLSEGFDLYIDSGIAIHVLSESELFGERRLGARKKRRPMQDSLQSFNELVNGDVVVHRDHGLGIFNGLVTLTLQNITNDFIQLTYQGEDKLYVPVDRLQCISKYQGISDKKPKLDRLGGKTWSNAKKKVKEAVWQIAQDLLKIYAKRELEQGRAYSQPGELFRELEESFPFEETTGQQKAIRDVLEDLTSDKPMDRLVCGDVGYGKTEVAIRAAFKVVEDGCQVAVLVPTTVLAEQHADTFNARLDGFPVTVERINRFRPQAQQKKIISDLKQGNIDILIGTHRLLSKDVKFKNLGLLIVDEEHRFGVSHKEKIKKLRAAVDVVTLTATPIPRTLQMSLLGVRDLSVINTPPEHRLPVKTFVARYDDLVIKEAVTRELQRGGQTFLVHNRVRSINGMARKVEKLVPLARVAVAHGQMAGRVLEEIMFKFINREIDVLVCTTIIESGLDIANANTIIINHADKLGLAEIYQLRGRVGRSTEQSYAYLLVPNLDGLAKNSRERLRALMDCNELGGGFKLALSDLQIRGGGNILGISQSGHIAAVGYDLYLELLQKTVIDLKRSATDQPAEEDIDPEINLRISAYIPDQYLADTAQRYIAYRKIAAVSGHDQLHDLQDELQDRYGKLPLETGNLFAVMALKMKLRQIRATKLEQGKSNLVFSFHETTPVKPQTILALIEKSPRNFRFTPDARLLVNLPEQTRQSPQVILQAAEQTIAALQEGAI